MQAPHPKKPADRQVRGLFGYADRAYFEIRFSRSMSLK